MNLHLDLRLSLNPHVSEPSDLWHVCTDAEVGRTNRANLVGKPNMPMVWQFANVAVKLTKDWQYFLVAINPGMELHYVAALLNDGRAFCNHTGLNGNTPRANFIEGRDTNAELPKFDEVRTCGGSTVRWVGGFVEMLNGDYPPPLKMGVTQPRSVADATPDRYLYTPQTHPHLFFAAVITGDDYQPRPFPNGARYEWYGTTPVSFLPHVCPGGRVAYPPQQTVENTPMLRRLG